ncbi:hypothetical protein CERZMDRAFT_101144 [Cercospora zeae-maydis SCOH1-5]|uniref:Uncharacterized protein n=1 Tax=Cercospora zeae-maydis SCOH1-5 TaxID=717836 RepID=A0A6A6F4I0_9PEZI|nr:hypothetical protein CERZMDRAFT_101144 [Cercospora zeae-maydis SCOH1-5]
MRNVGRREAAEHIELVTEGLHKIRLEHTATREQFNAGIRYLKNQLAGQKRTTDEERQAKYEARKEASSVKEEIKRLRQVCDNGYDKAQELRNTVASKNKSIAELNTQLDKERENAASAYQSGYNAGKEAARQAQQPADPSPNAPPTTEPVRDGLRQAWLHSLMLISTTGSAMYLSLSKALAVNDRPTISRLLAADARFGAPALHLAALFGDIELAKLLLGRGAAVNEVCDARSEKPGRRVHGVTAMHLAIAAHRHDMIRHLHHAGAKFTAPHLKHGKRATAPPRWLVSGRFLDMFGDDTAEVASVLRLLKRLGWNKYDGLNDRYENMRSIAERELQGRVELQKAILAEL